MRKSLDHFNHISEHVDNQKFPVAPRGSPKSLLYPPYQAMVIASVAWWRAWNLHFFWQACGEEEGTGSRASQFVELSGPVVEHGARLGLEVRSKGGLT